MEKLKIGNTIEVIGYRPAKYPPGVKDELGSEKLFESLVGRRFKVKRFDQYGHVELRPTRRDTVWIEADLVKLAIPSPKRQKRKP
jgi:hypothetical protein